MSASTAQNVVQFVGGARRSKAQKTKTVSQAELLRRFLTKEDKSTQYKYDKVFIRKCDVQVGIVLMNIGRLSYNTHWRVYRIATWIPFMQKNKEVERVYALSDDIYLENVDTGEKRTIRFGSLSYQAQWRLS